MSCYCDEGEAPSAYVEEDRKARKVHKCSECGGQILPGEKYRHTWGIWEGTAYAFKGCSDCRAFAAWALAHAKCICLNIGREHSDILDAMYDLNHECPGLHEEAKARSKAIRDKRRAQPAEMTA